MELGTWRTGIWDLRLETWWNGTWDLGLGRLRPGGLGLGNWDLVD